MRPCGDVGTMRLGGPGRSRVSASPPTEGPLRIAYILTQAPYLAGETFVVTEGAEMLAQGEEMLFLPLRPSSSLARVHPDQVARRAVGGRALSRPVLAAAAHELIGGRGAAGAARRVVLGARGTDRRVAPLARNLATLPKALSLIGALRAWRPDHIHAHFAASTATAAWIASEVLGVPWSFTAHAPTDIEKRNLMTGKVTSASFTRAISDHGRDSIIAGLPSELHERVVVVPMGVRRPQPRSALDDVPAGLRRSEGSPAILCAAQLIPRKGHVYLLRALAALRDRGMQTICHLVGAGPLEAALRTEVDERGLGDVVRFHGFVPNDRLMAALDAGCFDIAVMPSISEGVPVALMEPAARGVRIVATDVCGVGELVGPREGRLVPPGDARALTEALSAEIAAWRPGRPPTASTAVAERYCLSSNVRRLRGLIAEASR